MSVELDLSRVEELSGHAVPAWVRGVWQRTVLRTEGGEDQASTVIWIQTPTLYADIRVPAPGDASPLATPAGFAGWLDVEGQICRWKRPIDLHPGPEDRDQGAMFRADEVMTEIGLIANYLEDYRLVAPAKGCLAASRGDFTVEDGTVRFSPEGTLDILVATGSYCTHARRAGSSSLRHRRYDAGAGSAHAETCVGDPAVFGGGGGAWTVWTNDMGEADRDALLAAADMGGW